VTTSVAGISWIYRHRHHHRRTPATLDIAANTPSLCLKQCHRGTSPQSLAGGLLTTLVLYLDQ